MHSKLPAVWLLALLAGLGLFSETVYTPALVDIAHSLKTTNAWVEWTLTTYLAGFALGTLFWGGLSDRTGRKPSLIAGLIVYSIGCVGCYCSHSIEMLLISRLVQAFGASVTSVLVMSICRDAFHGPALGKIFATVGMMLGLFPAIGPVVGGLVDQCFGWSAIFLMLILCGIAATVCAWVQMPETHPSHARTRISLRTVGSKMIRDGRVWAFGWLVAGCNGISFSYYAEGPFVLIECLGLSASQYGVTMALNAMAYIVGSWASRQLQERWGSIKILGTGAGLMFFCVLFLSAAVLLFQWIMLPKTFIIAVIVGSMVLLTLGHACVTSNALALALRDYKYATGTASSLFGFFYYGIVGGLTFIMGLLHNGTMIPMPLFFMLLALSMVGTFIVKISKEPKSA